MKNIKLRSFFSVFLAVIIAFSCIAAVSAASVSIVKPPKKTVFYQGVDWSYTKDGSKISTIGDLDLTGTVLEVNGKEISYSKSGPFPNFYVSPDSGKWAVGANKIRIMGDSFNGYALATVTFVALQSISVITPPRQTIFVKDVDWELGPFDDVEFTSCDLTGLSIKAVYTDGTSKIISYPENKLIGWSVDPDIIEMHAGDQTLYATFCGKMAPYDVSFVLTPTFAPGDVNKDGMINSLDALTVLRHSTGIITLDASAAALADVQKDGLINSSDALKILQYTVGIINTLK